MLCSEKHLVNGRRLGKHSPKKNNKILRFDKYVAALPNAPATYDPGIAVPSWPMMLNDSIGDCTCAAAGHLAQWWTACTKGPANALVLPDSAIETAYEAVSGYDPATGDNDNGAAISDVLNYWRTTGIGGDKIAGSAFVDPSKEGMIKLATWMFGGIDIGVMLPQNAQGMNDYWDVPWKIKEKVNSGAPMPTTGGWAPGSWGGHSVPVIAYGLNVDGDGLSIVTWGQRIKMSWAFWKAYCDEAYAVLSQDWIETNGNSFNGLSLGTLQQDLALL